MSDPRNNQPPAPRCWCGNRDLQAFSSEYLRCAVCETLVVRDFPSIDLSQITNEEENLYGANYAQRHLQEDHGLPAFSARIRQDLPERCAHWLAALLNYKLPPAKLLELGSFHGGFVGLAKAAGYDARGLDVSPELARQAAERFGVEILAGPVEQQAIPARSLDVIALFDVLEHLQDPRRTLEHCRKLLRDDGIIVLQTPCYAEGRTFAEMQAAHDPFLPLFIPEHLYLFSRRSVRQLLRETGFPEINFEPAIFEQYDMFAFASAAPMRKVDLGRIGERLQSSPPGRLALALLDASRSREQYIQKSNETGKRLAQLDAEMQARWHQIQTLTELNRQRERDSIERGHQIQVLTTLVQQRQSEADNLAEQLAKLQILATSAEHRHAMYAASAQKQLSELTELAQRHEQEADKRAGQIQQLERWLQEVADRHQTYAAAATTQLKELAQLAQKREDEARQRSDQIAQLEKWLREGNSETRDLREQVGQLTDWLKQAQLENSGIRQAHLDAEKTVAALLARLSPPSA